MSAAIELRPLCRQCFKPKCRKARPLCRRIDNPRNYTCNCNNYPFPHRRGSGRCQENPNAAERMWTELLKPTRKAR